jgi:hypothetical protein
MKADEGSDLHSDDSEEQGGLILLISHYVR